MGLSSASIAASDSEFSEIVVVVLEFLGPRLLALLLLAGMLGRGAGMRLGVAVAVHGDRLAVGGRFAGQRLRRLRLGVGALIGGFEIDDVAQQNLAFVQLVAPDDDGLEGERAFAQPGDHRLAAGLDALGDGDLALARQKLDRAHLAQIHAHRIVGAVGGFLGGGLGLGDRGGGNHGAGRIGGALLARGRRLLGLVGVDDVDAHVGEHRHGVLDLLGGYLLGGQHLVQLVIGDIAARLRGLDHLLDRSVGHVEHGAVGGLRLGLLLILGFSGFGCHSCYSEAQIAIVSDALRPWARRARYSKRSHLRRILHTSD